MSLWLLALILFPAAQAVRFYLVDRERACFFITAPQQSLIRGEAIIENGPGAAKLFVEISHGTRMIYERHASDIGKFSILSLPAKDTVPEGAFEDVDDEDYGYQPEAKYKACVLLTVEPGPETQRRVKRAVRFTLDVPVVDDYKRTGSGKLQHEHVDTASKALNDMLAQLHGMVTDLTALQGRERKLVARNERTASRLGRLTILSIVVLFATASFQYGHYRQYFKAKKLC